MVPMAIIKGDLRSIVLPQKYGAIYADPAWQWTTWSDKGKKKSPDAHYQCMSLDDIKALPVADWALPDCALFLWAVDAMIPQALETIAAWGFEYKTVGFYWRKLTSKDNEFFGQGYWTRGNPECCFLATRGHPKRLSRAVRKLVNARRGAHSEKPGEVRRRIEKLVPGPYLELFARHDDSGWDCAGNQAGEREVSTQPSM